MTPALEPLLVHLPAWVLVLFRLTGLFLFAPMFGSRIIPGKVKIMLALMLSLCVYPALLDVGSPAHALVAPVIERGLGLWSTAGAVASELLIGLILGFGASLPLTAVQLGGRVIDQQIGLGLAGVFNPEIDDQSGVVGEFYFVLALTVFLILGGHRALLSTLVGSFSHVPLGGFVADAGMAHLVVGLVSSAFELAIRVAAPLLCLIFLETVAMGFIARTVPQLNILSIGFPLRILLGTGIVAAGVAMSNAAFVAAARGTMHRLTAYFMG